MAFCPEVVASEPHVHPLRRGFPRYALRSLAYVRLEQGNGGIIRDLTESGIAIQAVVPLRVNQTMSVCFDLLLPRVRIDARGRVAWADANGQGGIQFLGLTSRMQRSLRDWLFTQMLSCAAISGRDTMFCPLEPQLMLSASARPAILAEPPLSTYEFESARIRWGLFSLSVRNFSIFVDTLVLLCAVLLFSISSLAVMGGMPAWPLASALFLTAATIFVAVYQMLFSELLCGASPGKRLAMLAAGETGGEEQEQRFR
jgi:hypothetical protein